MISGIYVYDSGWMDEKQWQLTLERCTPFALCRSFRQIRVRWRIRKSALAFSKRWLSTLQCLREVLLLAEIHIIEAESAERQYPLRWRNKLLYFQFQPSTAWTIYSSSKWMKFDFRMGADAFLSDDSGHCRRNFSLDLERNQFKVDQEEVEKEWQKWSAKTRRAAVGIWGVRNSCTGHRKSVKRLHLQRGTCRFHRSFFFLVNLAAL